MFKGWPMKDLVVKAEPKDLAWDLNGFQDMDTE